MTPPIDRAVVPRDVLVLLALLDEIARLESERDRAEAVIDRARRWYEDVGVPEVFLRGVGTFSEPQWYQIAKADVARRGQGEAARGGTTA